jgi:hypothetical protein
MAIAFDSSAKGTLGASPVSHSHTCTGSDRILFVAAWGDAGNPTAVTYNGVSMTKIADIPANGDAYRGNLWYLVNPATGANNVTVTGAGLNVYGMSASFTGASQTGVPDASATESNLSTTSATIDVTTIADNCWTILCTTGTGVPTGMTNGTERQSANTNHLGDSNGAKTPAGATSITSTFGASANAYSVIASFAPSVASTTTSSLMLMGMGT